MKISNFILILIGGWASSGILTEVYGVEVFLVWLLVLLKSYFQIKNQFISVLLLMEYMMMVLILFSVFYVCGSGGMLSVCFMFMSFSVGEAVLGLALIVRLARVSSSEHMSSFAAW